MLSEQPLIIAAGPRRQAIFVDKGELGDQCPVFQLLGDQYLAYFRSSVHELTPWGSRSQNDEVSLFSSFLEFFVVLGTKLDSGEDVIGLLNRGSESSVISLECVLGVLQTENLRRVDWGSAPSLGRDLTDRQRQTSQKPTSGPD